MRLEDKSREELIAMLVANDPNGTWTDEDCRDEDMEPVTREEAIETLRRWESENAPPRRREQDHGEDLISMARYGCEMAEKAIDAFELHEAPAAEAAWSYLLTEAEEGEGDPEGNLRRLVVHRPEWQLAILKAVFVATYDAFLAAARGGAA